MPCLNPKNQLPHVITYDPKNPQLQFVGGATAIQARKGEQFDYWYCQFSCHNSFKIYDIEKLIPSDVLLRIKNKDAFLVLDNGLEPFLKSADGIYFNIVMPGKIPASQIIFMSSVPTMADYVNGLRKRLGQDSIKVEWFSMFEYQLWDVISNQLTEPPNTLEIKKYDKKFINFNRRWRLHRPLIVTLLHDKNLLDAGYISLGTSDFHQDTWDSRWAELLRYYNDSEEILEILQRNQEVKRLPPMYLDTEDLITNRADQTTSTYNYYENSYFSIVNETTYHTKFGHDAVPFLSEKIFKCIAMKHPFILVTVPHSLRYLKELGYKTFEFLIDEDYDNEINDSKRILKIVSEVERLCNLNNDELEKFLIDAKKICEYNYNILKEKTSFIKEMTIGI
jgi:hypothetical protein